MRSLRVVVTALAMLLTTLTGLVAAATAANAADEYTRTAAVSAMGKEADVDSLRPRMSADGERAAALWVDATNYDTHTLDVVTATYSRLYSGFVWDTENGPTKRTTVFSEDAYTKIGGQSGQIQNPVTFAMSADGTELSAAWINEVDTRNQGCVVDDGWTNFDSDAWSGTYRFGYELKVRTAALVNGEYMWAAQAQTVATTVGNADTAAPSDTQPDAFQSVQLALAGDGSSIAVAWQQGTGYGSGVINLQLGVATTAVPQWPASATTLSNALSSWAQQPQLALASFGVTGPAIAAALVWVANQQTGPDGGFERRVESAFAIIAQGSAIWQATADGTSQVISAAGVEPQGLSVAITSPSDDAPVKVVAAWTQYADVDRYSGHTFEVARAALQQGGSMLWDPRESSCRYSSWITVTGACYGAWSDNYVKGLYMAADGSGVVLAAGGSRVFSGSYSADEISWFRSSVDSDLNLVPKEVATSSLSDDPAEALSADGSTFAASWRSSSSNPRTISTSTNHLVNGQFPWSLDATVDAAAALTEATAAFVERVHTAISANGRRSLTAWIGTRGTSNYVVQTVYHGPPSSDATLAGIYEPDGFPDPAWDIFTDPAFDNHDLVTDPSITSYDAWVEEQTSDLTIDPRAADTGATVRFREGTAGPFRSLESDGWAQSYLDYGVNTLQLEVTAEDGVTKKIYTLNVTRDPTDSTLHWVDPVLDSMYVDTVYDDSVTATSGSGPVQYSLRTGYQLVDRIWTEIWNLPAGLSLDQATGAITGTPTTAGDYWFVLVAEDGVWHQVYRTYAMTVGEAPLLDATKPVVAGSTDATVTAGTTAVATYSANETVTWTLAGTDKNLFTVVDGVLTFEGAIPLTGGHTEWKTKLMLEGAPVPAALTAVRFLGQVSSTDGFELLVDGKAIARLGEDNLRLDVRDLELLPEDFAVVHEFTGQFATVPNEIDSASRFELRIARLLLERKTVQFPWMDSISFKVKDADAPEVQALRAGEATDCLVAMDRFTISCFGKSVLLGNVEFFAERAVARAIDIDDPLRLSASNGRLLLARMVPRGRPPANWDEVAEWGLAELTEPARHSGSDVGTPSPTAE